MKLNVKWHIDRKSVHSKINTQTKNASERFENKLKTKKMKTSFSPVIDEPKFIGTAIIIIVNFGIMIINKNSTVNNNNNGSWQITLIRIIIRKILKLVVLFITVISATINNISNNNKLLL